MKNWGNIYYNVAPDGLNLKENQKLSFALLVSYCTWSLACRLTWCLTLATATLNSWLLEISLVDSHNMLHKKVTSWRTLIQRICLVIIIPQNYYDFNKNRENKIIKLLIQSNLQRKSVFFVHNLYIKFDKQVEFFIYKIFDSVYFGAFLIHSFIVGKDFGLGYFELKSIPLTL